MTKPLATTAPKRHYDAAASRQALLDAAAALFDERGYERATTRDIGERAGVDPALIARYFGGKEGLYLAVLDDPAKTRPIPCADRAPSAAVRDMLEFWDSRGSTPMRRALVSADPSPQAHDQIVAILRTRMLAPLADELQRRGVPDAQLRAEIALAVATGLTTLRENGLLERLAAADLSEVLALVEPMLRLLESAESADR
jgi:AcrR family transcriptional regulator